jgi:ParB/RepB/Spo0J family partition protein
VPTKISTRWVPIEHLEPNPWNPNRQSDTIQKAERESISTYGFIDPITVRANPLHEQGESDAPWQIIDGEHRWGAAQDLELAEVPIVVIKVDDSTAKKLTIILNETKGESDLPSLGALLADIRSSEDEGFEIALPYTKAELDNLLSLADVDWSAYERSNGDDGGNGDGPTAREGHVLSLEFSSARKHADVSKWIKMLCREWGVDESEAVLRAVKSAAQSL